MSFRDVIGFGSQIQLLIIVRSCCVLPSQLIFVYFERTKSELCCMYSRHTRFESFCSHLRNFTIYIINTKWTVLINLSEFIVKLTSHQNPPNLLRFIHTRHFIFFHLSLCFGLWTLLVCSKSFSIENVECACVFPLLISSNQNKQKKCSMHLQKTFILVRDVNWLVRVLQA